MIDYEKIIRDYKEALRLSIGDERVEKSVFYYRKGWFYCEIAKKFADGSIGVTSSIYGHAAYRAKEIIERTNRLIQRNAGTK